MALLSSTPDFSQIKFHFSSLLFESRGSVFNRSAIFSADEHAKFEKDTLNEVVISWKFVHNVPYQPSDDFTWLFFLLNNQFQEQLILVCPADFVTKGILLMTLPFFLLRLSSNWKHGWPSTPSQTSKHFEPPSSAHSSRNVCLLGDWVIEQQ